MEIIKTTEGSTATLAVKGWLDTQTAPELGVAVEELGPETESLTLDCAELDYIASSGIRQIVAAHKKMGGNLTLVNVSSEVKEVLRMTGTDKRLNIR